MKPLPVVLLLFSGSALQCADEFAGLAQSVRDLSKQIQEAGGKTVAVVDLVDLQGHVLEFGRTLAEEMTTLLVQQGKPLRIVDRTSLRALLHELQLTEQRIVAPENSRRLKISGVDVLITGTLTPLGDKVRINVKALDTSSGTIMGASTLSIDRTDAVDRLLRFDAGSNRPETNSTSSRDIGDYQGQRAIQQIQYLEVSLTSFEVLRDGEIRVTLQFANVNRSAGGLGVCLKAENSDGMPDFWKFSPVLVGNVTDDKGTKYSPSGQSGIGFCRTADDWLILTPGNKAPVVLSFISPSTHPTASVFSMTADIRLITRTNGQQNPPLTTTLSFANIRPKRP